MTDDDPTTRPLSRREQSRAAILEAAGPLLIMHGAAAVTMERIARAAQVSPRTMFNHFPTRADLMAAVAHERAIAAAAYIDNSRARKPSSLMRSLSEDMLKASRTRGPYFLEFLGDITRSSATADNVRHGVIGRAAHRFARRSLPEGPHAEALGDLLLGALLMAASNLAANPDFDIIGSIKAQGIALDAVAAQRP